MLWMETRFDAGVVQNFIDLESIVNITGANVENMSIPILDLRTFERFRYVVHNSAISLFRHGIVF